jgi:hypothetical protein
MRRVLIAVTALLLVGACASGETTVTTTAAIPAETTAVAAGSLAPEGSEAAREAQDRLEHLCTDYCDFLVAAGDEDCLDRAETVAECADYVGRLESAVAAIDGVVRGLLATHEHQALLEATRGMLLEGAAFVRHGCRQAGAGDTAGACVVQTSRTLVAAAEVGRLLRDAAVE